MAELERVQILESVKIQGELVRKLKAEKAPKEQVCIFIDFIPAEIT